MSGDQRRTSQTKSALPVPQEPRPVGVRAGNTVFMPVLPTDGSNAAAIRAHDNVFLGVLSVADAIFAAAEQINAPRTVIYDPVGEREAREEAEKEVQHQRELAKRRREKEIFEAERETLKAMHGLEAEAEFKHHKFKVGAARFGEKAAQFRTGEAVAREASLDGEIFEPENKREPKSASMAQMLAQRADDLQKRIDGEEAAGRPTEELRNQFNVINVMLREELLRRGP